MVARTGFGFGSCARRAFGWPAFSDSGLWGFLKSWSKLKANVMLV